MRKLRVAHVITRLCKGGAQENTFHTIRLANRDRFEVDLISGPTDGPEGSIEEAVAAAGIEIVRVPGLCRSVAPIRDIRAYSELARLFRERRYDIVHTHTSKAGFVGRLAARRTKVPIVIHTPHGNIFHGYFGRWPTRMFVALERRAACWCDRIIELTRSGVEESLAQGIGRPEQYRVVFSGIDLTPFQDALGRREQTRNALGVRPDDVLVAAVGRLEAIKGFTYFIAAADRIAAAVPNARFILAGSGSLETTLRAEAASLGERFRFLGRRDDVPDLMAAADIVVVPSLNEGMGRVILEAGAAGRPVVASAVGGIPEIVQDAKTGVLVPPKSPEVIAEVVIALARDPARRTVMGLAARQYVTPEFSLENMVRRIEVVYDDVIREKGLDV